MLTYQEIQNEILKLRILLRWAMATKDYDAQHRYTTAIYHLKDTLIETLSPLKGVA